MREHFLPNAVAVWIAPEIYDRSLSWAEAKQILGTINWESAVLSMAMVNAVSAELALGGDLGTRIGAVRVEMLANYLFPAELRSRAMDIYRANAHQTFLPLAPQACIAMTESCLRYCAREGGDAI